MEATLAQSAMLILAGNGSLDLGDVQFTVMQCSPIKKTGISWKQGDATLTDIRCLQVYL